MKINFSQELKNIEGETLMRSRRKDDVVVEIPADLRWAAVEALLTTAPDATLSGEEKARRYELALRIQEATVEIDLSVDDISFVKKLCDTHFPPLVMGQTRRMLEGKTTQEG
jgi:hypothetical protein